MLPPGIINKILDSILDKKSNRPPGLVCQAYFSQNLLIIDLKHIKDGEQ